MSISLRIPRQLLERVRQDLHRPHGIAAERIGWLFTRDARCGPANALALAFDYESVPDTEYLSDATVGAKVGGRELRRVLQQAMDRQHGVFHVHAHQFSNRPEFSNVDTESNRLLIPSFQAVAPDNIHGALLLGSRRCMADCWPAGHESPTRAECVSIVGYPSSLYRCDI